MARASLAAACPECFSTAAVVSSINRRSLYSVRSPWRSELLRAVADDFGAGKAVTASARAGTSPALTSSDTGRFELGLNRSASRKTPTRLP